MVFTNNKTDIMKLNLEKKISQFELVSNGGTIGNLH